MVCHRQLNDSMCAPKPPATPVAVGFNNGGWFPYKQTQYRYTYGGSLAYLYPQANQSQVQDLLNAFTFERYNLWKQNWVLTDSNACGTGTARVYSDNPTGTLARVKGMAWPWQPPSATRTSSASCGTSSAPIARKQSTAASWGGCSKPRRLTPLLPLVKPQDSFASSGGNHDSAFDGDVDIGIGLVFGALQWPEYINAATDWLTRMECEGEHQVRQQGRERQRLQLPHLRR